MHCDLILASLLLSGQQTWRAAPPAEEVPLAPIDVAALRALAGRAPAEMPRPGTLDVAEALPLAA